MDKEDLDLITEYSKGTLSKASLIKKRGKHYTNLVDIYLNDLNSSKLRQDVVCNILGMKISNNKLGYDSEGSNDEVKPKNISSTSKNKSKNKLNCVGNYSDLTHKRHKKYVEDNAIIHSAGFIDGQLMYIIKIPYIGIESHFQKTLNEKLPDGDLPNRYVRSASFGFKEIKNCQTVEIEFVRENVDDYSSFIVKELYNYIKEKNDDK